MVLVVHKERRAPDRCRTEVGYIVKMVDYSLEVPAVTPERTAAVSSFKGIVGVVVAGIGIGETVRIYQVDEVGGGKALPCRGAFLTG